jgi:hypothetical protein
LKPLFEIVEAVKLVWVLIETLSDLQVDTLVQLVQSVAPLVQSAVSFVRVLKKLFSEEIKILSLQFEGLEPVKF